MGSPKDLNNPEVYTDALVLAALNNDPMAVAAWLAEDDNVAENPFFKWYNFFAERLIDLAPRPELGFRARPKRATQPPKIGRNDLCPCGSKKKFKQCHIGKEDVVAWKMGSPTPSIRAMAVAKIVHELPMEILDQVPQENISAVALAEMSAVYRKAERLEEALGMLKQVLEGERDDPHLLYDYWIARYAELLVEADRAGEGESFLMDEYDAPRQVTTAQVAQKLAAFYVDQEDTINAETWVETALEEDPGHPFNHLLKGMLSHYSEDWDTAISAYKTALSHSNRFREEEKHYMSELVREGLEQAQNKQPLDNEEDEEIEENKESKVTVTVVEESQS